MENDEGGGGFVGVGRGGLALWSISNMEKPEEAGEGEGGGGLGVILAASISNLENMGGGVGGRGRGVVAEKDEGRMRRRCFSCYRGCRFKSHNLRIC